jgi:conjugative transfer region protein (TIGR03748 family)
MQRRRIAVILLAILLDKTCLADNNVTQITRYLTVTNKPNFSQVNLLSQSIQVRFAQNIQTVGDAMNYLLRFSGYALIAESQQSLALKIILSKPLPIIDRELGPMTLSNGLTTLSGSAFYLVEDPVNRVVDFKLKPEYQKFTRNNQVNRSQQ